MISSDRLKDIEKCVMASATAMEAGFASKESSPRLAAFAGSAITVKTSRREMDNTDREMVVYDVKWSHPARHGGVRLKLEFYAVPPRVLEDYQARAGVHHGGIPSESLRPAVRADIRADERIFEPTDKEIAEQIPVATPSAVYGDKLVALAMRPYLKYRDFYDLWWLRTQLGVQLDDNAIVARVRESAAIYGYSDEEIAAKSAALLGSPPSEVQSIEDNLKAFLPPEVHAACAKAGSFNDMFSNAMDELGRVRHLISQSDMAFK